MPTKYFTFGQTHEHILNGIVYDKDVVVQITHHSPRDVMFENFGMKWGFEYSDKPDMKLFPRGIILLDPTT